GFSYVIDWGDGTPATTVDATAGNGSGVHVQHTYAAAGDYTVGVTATDRDGATGSSSTTITAANRAPVAGVTGPASGVYGRVQTFTLSANDAPADLLAGFTFHVEWGDGQSSDVTGQSGTQTTHVFDVSG